MPEQTAAIPWPAMLTAIVAGYAALVATFALALELRRWFESGARLSVFIHPEMNTVNIPGTEDNTDLLAHVTNRGNVATTITHLAVRDFGSRLGRLRRVPVWTAAVLIPGLPGTP